MQFLTFSLSLVAVLIQHASSDAPEDAPQVLTSPSPTPAPPVKASNHHQEDDEPRDGLSLAEDLVFTALQVFPNKDLSQLFIDTMKGVNGLFVKEEMYDFVKRLVDNLNRLTLIPDNLKSLTKVADVATRLLTDERYHEIITRELKLVDQFLEDDLARLTFIKLGGVMSRTTSNPAMYEAVGSLLDQVNLLIGKDNVKAMHKLVAQMSPVLISVSDPDSVPGLTRIYTHRIFDEN